MSRTRLLFGRDPSIQIRRDDIRDAADSLLTGDRPKLVYIDPPFAAARDFELTVDHRGRHRRVAFSDKWDDLDSYLVFMRAALEAIHHALDDDGSLLLHCDHRAAPYLAIACDEIFGFGDRGRVKRAPGFRNELIWSYGLGGSSARCYPKKHDTILWYSKSSNWKFDPPMVPATSQRMAGQMKKATDVFEVASINNMAKERSGYPTQKPLALIERLVRAHTDEGDLVADFFCGSGTTAVAAAHTRRRAFVSDIGPDAVETTMARLIERGVSWVFDGELPSGEPPPRDGAAIRPWDDDAPIEAVFAGRSEPDGVVLTGFEDWRGVNIPVGAARLHAAGADAGGDWAHVRDTTGRRWNGALSDDGAGGPA